ncbi:MAG: tetratricopeptide repeat protein [Nitrospirota bacterium]|nr:tetratricopeptide repeat protein [Nitrospirota bacterium]
MNTINRTCSGTWRGWARTLAALCLLGLAACAEEGVKPEAALDTPEHHYSTGLRLFDKADYDGAMKEFTRAVALDADYAPGHAGMGLVYGQKRAFSQAYESLDKARGLQKPPMVVAQVMKIRVLTMERGDDWLKDAESEYKHGAKIDPQNAALHYYMGRAYRMGFEFDKAAEHFKAVLDLNRDLVGDADREWKLVQKIQRAAPGTKIGKEIALVDQISRADVAALFIEELGLDRFYEKRGKTFDSSFKAPGQTFQADKVVAMEPAADIATHPLKADIDTVVKLGVRGLEPSPDHKFEPSKPITKAEYATMLEDIMIRITNDDKLSTQYFGQKSPFPDVRPDLYYFNAAMIMTSRGILEADKVTGEFGATQSVSGADALLAIRMFKESLKI